MHCITAARTIGLYGVCNLAMLLGMVMAEHTITRLTIGLSEITAGMLVMTAMLAGMAAGMGAVLALVARLPRVANTFGRIA